MSNGVKGGEGGTPGQGAAGHVSTEGTQGQGGQPGEDWVPRTRLNEVISQRDDFKTKAETLDRIMEDERFLEFTNIVGDGRWDEVVRVVSGEGTPGSTDTLPGPGGEGDLATEGMKQIQKQLADISDKFDKRLSSLEENVAGVGTSTILQTMLTQKDDATGELAFPRMQDKSFRESMGKLIREGRTTNWQDAYDLAEVGDVRKERDEALEGGGQEPVTLDSTFGNQPIVGSDGKPKLYKSPEEAIHDSMNKLGIRF